MTDTAHHPILLKMLDALRHATVPDLMKMAPSFTQEEVSDILCNLTMFLAGMNVPEGDQMILLALHFGVINAELDEAVRLGHMTPLIQQTSGWAPTFEDRLLLFCEQARAAYRDREAYGGSIEGQANVHTPSSVM